MTLVVPAAHAMTITVERMGAVVWVGIAISALTVLGAGLAALQVRVGAMVTTRAPALSTLRGGVAQRSRRGGVGGEQRHHRDPGDHLEHRLLMEARAVARAMAWALRRFCSTRVRHGDLEHDGGFAHHRAVAVEPLAFGAVAGEPVGKRGVTSVAMKALTSAPLTGPVSEPMPR